ncbi:MAG: amidase family protein, partial [Solirubrobacteraceae bacterium]|nr:amidase family protein [Solirubrobacteraceae bacterium]
ASWCGVFGHVPSHGLVSKRGHLPRPLTSLLEPPLSTTGPLARSARDLSLLLRAMVGAAHPDDAVWTPVLPVARRTVLAGTRVGLWFDDEVAPVDDEVRAVVSQLAERLGEAGCVVTPFRAPHDTRAMASLFDRLQDAELSYGLAPEEWDAAAAAERDLGPEAKLLSQSRRQAWHDAEAQAALSAAWDAQFDTVDVVLSPTVPFAAPMHSTVPPADRRTELRGREHATRDLVSGWSRLTNVLRAPATIVPAGLGAASGLPIGAQLIGPRYADLTTLGIAALLDAAALLPRLTPPAA